MKTLIIVVLFLISLSGSSQVPKANKKVLEYAESKLGQRVGNGWCYALVDSALFHVNNEWENGSVFIYDYCRKISNKKRAKPGDIAVYTDRLYRYAGHTDILLDKNKNGRWNTLGQNLNETLEESKVVIVENIRIFSFSAQTVEIYRPYSKIIYTFVRIFTKKQLIENN